MVGVRIVVGLAFGALRKGWMRKMGRRRATLLGAAILSCVVRSAGAGTVLYDAADAHLLEAADADVVVDAGRTSDLLLVAVLCERLHAGALTTTTRVPVVAAAGDREPHPEAQELVEIGELLQLVLLSDSRTAATTLASAVGPGIAQARARMRDVGARLRLTHTAVAEEWPSTAGGAPTTRDPRVAGRTTARELGRLALAILREPEIRRRIDLDGVPIVEGRLIARATAPLISVSRDGAAAGPIAAPGPHITLAERSGLPLLAVATGPKALEELTAATERGFARYRRIEVVRAGQAVGPTVHVRGGIIPNFKAVAAEPWSVTTRVAAPAGLAFRLQLPAEIQAPVEVHQPLGELVVERDGRVLAVVPLVAPQAIAPSGWLDTARGSSDR